MTVADDILDTSKTVLSAVFFAGKVPTGQPAPYAIFHPAVPVPGGRQLGGSAANRTSIHRLIAVSNNSNGAAIVADKLARAIDGTYATTGGLLTVEYVSPPIDDRTDPSAVWWSSTLEIHHHTRS